jgi:hypothetical protein
MENSEDPARKLSNLAGRGASSKPKKKLITRAHMQKGEDSRRLEKQHWAKEGADWAKVGPGRSAQAGWPSPLWGPITPPLT